MTSAWLLPEHIADVLPSEARRIEELRRKLLDLARGYGFELVIPPMLEHLESLLSGTGHALDLKTFKLVDQLSGRMLGVRADTTPQVARIDAHLLNRQGVARLCYCGPALHARPDHPLATRELLQFGAEIYGHSGLEADLEIQDLALDGLAAALDDLAWLGRHVRAARPAMEVAFDLSDMSGYAYYSGVRFSVYAAGSTDALLRGGRYDEVGAVFGRNRPAVGFSLDLRALSAAMPAAPLKAAIRAPWSEDAGLRAAIRALRADNETVVCALPGHDHETQEFACDRELVAVGPEWRLRPLA